MKMMNKKGQLSITNILFWVILVAIGAVVTPILSDFAYQASQQANSSLGTVIAQAIVPMFWLGIIITFFIYISPIRPSQY